ncbi:hypothetical protein DICPUDRAFT_149048 [Dictyostelium purpureum]|uniref:Uncharacterized protein n=1 Tax=Dictyostelium purpureum TaxID=5786 RepID=F0ZCP6_DICPU|nr:uncharacterized protein DICPUDRAFT_149048 [Dictyostelium purpureum]EGC38306.1 hypothetical protein DICPUDRAFT_149048 [Dictyostelium purpureum]|eukprot:XP_003285167.1 hypothetical protein DICPUDRAFT_149048 [Dictyostelium purpureum]
MAPTKELSSKDQAAIKNISKLFDDKKYKKGLKACDAFLKTHPDNVDASCFKSLIIYNMDQKEEAHEIANKAIKSNMTSSIAWHTLGFLHRQDKNYLEAGKAFKMASKNNKESSQILRDLSSIQLYARDLTGLKESYAALLKLQPSIKSHWIGLIITYHLMGQQKAAFSILEKFFDILDDKEKTGLRYSELLLYKCMLLDEMQEYDQALNILVKEEKIILDKLWAKQKQAEILMKKNENQKAETILRNLIKLNPDNLNVHKKLWESKNIKSENLENLDQEKINLLKDLYKDLEQQYPKSVLIQKIPLMFLQDKQEFREHLVKYSGKFLTKNIPSLFNSLKCLYNNKDKVEVITQVFLDHLQSLKDNQTLSGSSEKESPSTILWCYYYLGQHYDKLNDFKESLDYIEQGIKHTPTCLDFYVIKAKLYKHQGDVQRAFEEYDTARKLDLADRYLNTKCAKYALRNNDPDTAEAIFSLIKDESQTLMFNMSEFQVIWYENELGAAYLRSGDYAKALKLFNLVEKHFGEFLEDQMDFHNHIQKKLTLRSYIEFLRWEDVVYQNKPYFDTAKFAARTFLNIQKKPEFVLPLKKVPAIAKPPAPPKSTEPKKDPSTGLTIPEDDDPNGEKYLAKHMNDLWTPALVFVDNLIKFAPNDIEGHSLSCQINLQQKKYLVILKTLLKIKSINENSPLYHKNLMELLIQVSKDTEVSAIVKAAIEKQLSLASDTNSLLAFNQSFADKHKDSAQHRFVAGEILYKLSPESKDKALELIMNVNGETNWEQCVNNLESLSTILPDSVKQYKEKLHSIFPLANAFAEEQQN